MPQEGVDYGLPRRLESERLRSIYCLKLNTIETRAENMGRARWVDPIF